MTNRDIPSERSRRSLRQPAGTGKVPSRHDWRGCGRTGATKGQPGGTSDLGMSFTTALEDIIMTEQPKDISGRGERQALTANEDFWGPPISVYTREQAFEDGVLVDVTPWASSGPDG